MVYLYAGLGVVMLSGIMAIFEMGLSLTGQSLLPIPINNYPGSAEQTREYDLLTASKSLSPGLTGMNICTELKSLYGEELSSGEFLPDVKHPDWNNGCVVEYGLHQILIAPNPPTYLILFCRESEKNSLVCPFEQM